MFETYTEEQYRALDFDALEARKSMIVELADNPETTAEEMRSLEEESKLCRAEYARREEFAELRSAKLTAVNHGEGEVITRSAEEEEAIVADMYDTEEYRNAFMQYIQRGTEIPMELRAYPTTNDITHTSDIAPQIPTTMGQQIISKMEEYGTIWNKVKKLSVKGGLWFRVLDLNPVATWIDEDNPSKTQKVGGGTKVQFSFYMLECRLAQTLLAGAVSFDDFQALFVPAIAKAMVKALEAAIIAGTGTGMPLGITNDSRITNIVEMKSTDFSDWVAWHKRVKAAMPKEYRNGQFILAQGSWDKYIETLRDADNHPVSQTGYNPVTGEEEYRLMGKPVFTVTDAILPDFDGASNGDIVGIFGNLDNYAVNTQPGMPMTTKRWIDEDTNQEKLKSLVALDGKVLDPYGFILIKKVSAYTAG